MPSIDYPFPDPRNDEEREANRKAAKEAEEVAGLSQPTVTATVYTVSLLPAGHLNYERYALSVAYVGRGRWVVTHGAGVYLDAAGRWSEAAEDPTTGNATQSYFDRDAALDLAQRAAPSVAVNGITAADVVLGRKRADGR